MDESDWCSGAEVERPGSSEYGWCGACGKIVKAKKDGTARRHRPFR